MTHIAAIMVAEDGPRGAVAIPTTIIVCYQALPYITDRPSLQYASVVVLVNPWGNPPFCPIQITLHRARCSDVASDRERTNPGPQPHGPAQLSAGPRPAVCSLWKNIFECLPHSLALCPPPSNNMLLSFPWAFYGGWCVKCGRDSASSGFTSGHREVLVCSGMSRKDSQTL